MLRTGWCSKAMHLPLTPLMPSSRTISSTTSTHFIAAPTLIAVKTILHERSPRGRTKQRTSLLSLMLSASGCRTVDLRMQIASSSSLSWFCLAVANSLDAQHFVATALQLVLDPFYLNAKATRVKLLHQQTQVG